jgi:S1-C subfamily serine protease
MDQDSRPNLKRITSGLRRARSLGARILPYFLSVVVAFLAFLVFYNMAIKPKEITGGDVSQAIEQAMASATAPPAYSAQVYKTIQPSLVLIQTHTTHTAQPDDYGLGSGVVIDKTGSILTSLHVVNGASEIEVTFADGTKANAQVKSTQPDNDIAILQAPALPLGIVPAVLGNPDSMDVGDEAFVVGNPFGLYSSMSAGVISGFDRTFRPPTGYHMLKGLIQIDAAVNPGNSGGPLLNRDGYVIGIVTGIINPTEENFFVGIAFAVPITIAVGGSGSPPF